jgi:hypothetical protein
VAKTNLVVVNSDLYNQSKRDVNDYECSNCVLLETQLSSALEELKSTKLIINLLQEELGKASPRGDRNSVTINPPEDKSAKMYSKGLENRKWTLISEKCRRKGFPQKNLTDVTNTYPLATANRYKKLTNLQNTLGKVNRLEIQEDNNIPDILTREHQTNQQHRGGRRSQRIDKENREDAQINHIPTLLNGKTGNTSMETVRGAATRKKYATKKKVRQHNVTMIGDSFLRGIRENVEASVTDKFGIYREVKPGCDLKNLLEAAKRFTGSITHKDVLFICGGQMTSVLIRMNQL